VESWDEYQYFLAIARAGTLSAAGQRLKVDTSTVHRRLGALEQRLGTRLFDRLARGFVLTEAGEELLAAVTRIDQEIVATERGLHGTDKKPAGKVRLTTVDAWASQPLGQILADLRSRYPEIEVEVTVTTRLLNLTRRETDLALRPGAAPTEPGVIGRRFANVAVAVYASRAYLQTHEPPASYDDLARHAVVTGDEGLAHVRFVRFMRDRTKDAIVALRCDSVAVMASAVRAGFGLAALPCSIGDSEPDLVRVLPPHPEMGVEAWLLMHEDMKRSARVRVVADALYEAMLGYRDLFEGRSGDAAVAPAPANCAPRPGRAKAPRKPR
jgi:DNA-binding transcriptional LysR family regulator